MNVSLASGGHGSNCDIQVDGANVVERSMALHEAITNAQNKNKTICLAAGVYGPQILRDPCLNNGDPIIDPDLRCKTFEVTVNKLTLQGAGMEDTILNGDLMGNDLPYDPDNPFDGDVFVSTDADNTFHVINVDVETNPPKLVVKKSKFTNNVTFGFGGAIAASRARLDLSHSVFDANHAPSSSAPAIDVLQASFKIRHNVFTNHTGALNGAIRTIIDSEFSNAVGSSSVM